MTNTLLGIACVGIVVLLITNWLHWCALERYRDLFAAVYQLAGRIVMNDDADDWHNARVLREAEQTLLLDILSDPDGKKAEAFLHSDAEAADLLRGPYF